MFENYTTSKQKQLPRYAVVAMIISISSLVLALGSFWVYGWWKIVKLELPKEGVAIAVSAPPPAPPPAKKGSKKKKPVDKKIPVKKKPTDLTQTVKLDKPADSQEADIDSDVEGNPDGHENGVDWSDCTGPACDPNSPLLGDPPPPPKVEKVEEPQAVPQVALEQQRLSGEKNIKPDDTTKLSIKRDGKTRVLTTVKMCLSAGGVVSKLQMLKSSGYPAYDSQIKSTMRGWKYRPFMVNGRAVPVCTSVTFIYNQRN